MMKHLFAILYAIAAFAVTPASAATVIYIDSYRFGEPASPPPGGDPYFANVTYLVTNEGSNGSTPSPAVVGGTINYTDSAALSTASAPTGQSSSLYLDATGARDSIWLNSGAGSQLTGDFTVEIWFAINNSGNVNNARLFDIGANKLSVFLNGRVESDPTISIYGAASYIINSHALSTWTPGTWHSVCVSRSGSTVYLFFDGVLQTTATNSATLGATINGMSIGAYFKGAGNHLADSYIGPFRLTDGVCRYTATYTVPTLPLPES